MYRKSIVAVALFGAMSSTAFAEDWYLISPVNAGGCKAVTRMAGAGENQVAGPYQTQEEAEAAQKEFAACATSSNK